ncbi:hypothetical protein D3C73_1437080 [compost metagenome]
MLKHGWQEGPRQSNSGEQVDVEVLLPVLVRNVQGILRLVDTEIVDQDVHLPCLADEFRNPPLGAEVRRDGPGLAHISECGNVGSRTVQ